MIKANELRIGNYLIDNVIHEAGKITCISVLDNDIYSGIPLTPELLVKCGAIQSGIEYNLRLGATNMTLRCNAGKCYLQIGDFYIGEIESLHRLQNLYFDLSRQELKIDLNAQDNLNN